MAEVTGPNVGTTMIFIHGAITRGLRVSVERGTEFAQGGYPDAATQAGFALYCRTLVSVLRGHHMSEDAVAFPFLRDKLPDVPFDKLMADHRVMDGLLDEFEAGSEAVAAEAQVGPSLADLVHTATTLSDLWHPHIQIEEQRIYAAEVIAAVMDADENAQVGQRLGEYAQEHVQPLSLGLPFLLYNQPRQDREAYAATMPPMVTEQLVPVVWKEEWAPMQPFLLK
jgi:hypothetical protein